MRPNGENGLINGCEETIASRFGRVMESIAHACSSVGRDPSGVKLVTVAKNFGPESVEEAIRAGADIIGESRVQEAQQKILLCTGGVRWHMIGHLQGNKVSTAVRIFDMIHSVDSMRLLDAVEGACEEAGRSIQVCLQVNVSGESSKFGLPPGELPAIVERSMRLSRVSVVGLMTIPPFDEDPGKARPFFRRLMEVRDEVAEGTGVELAELSMGMTGDMEVAIQEGATYVRVGTGIFGARKC